MNQTSVSRSASDQEQGSANIAVPTASNVEENNATNTKHDETNDDDDETNTQQNNVDEDQTAPLIIRAPFNGAVISVHVVINNDARLVLVNSKPISVKRGIGKIHQKYTITSGGLFLEHALPGATTTSAALAQATFVTAAQLLNHEYPTLWSVVTLLGATVESAANPGVPLAVPPVPLSLPPPAMKNANSAFVVRVCRPNELARAALSGRVEVPPNRLLSNYTLEGHVIHNTATMSSNFFSGMLVTNQQNTIEGLVKYVNSEYFYFNTNSGFDIIAFRVADFRGKVFDAAQHVKGATASNFAAAMNEIIFNGHLRHADIAYQQHFAAAPSTTDPSWTDLWNGIQQGMSESRNTGTE